MMAAEDVPTSYCSVHVEESLCYTDDTYHVANEACEEEGTVGKYGMLNYARQFPIAGVVVADQQYCIGTLTKEAGYSEARCDTLDPVNDTCPFHTVHSSRIATDTDDDDDEADYDDDDDDDIDQDNDDEEDTAGGEVENDLDQRED
jgi:hypothetical protein